MPLRAACAATISSVARDVLDEEAFGHEHDGLAARDLGQPLRDALEVLQRPRGQHPRLAHVEPRLLLDQVLDVAEAALALARRRILLAGLVPERVDDLARAVGDARRARPRCRCAATRRTARAAPARFSNAGCTARMPSSSSPLSTVSRPWYMPPLRNTPPASPSWNISRTNFSAPSLTRISESLARCPSSNSITNTRCALYCACSGSCSFADALGEEDVVGDHEELLDLLRLAVLEERDVLGASRSGTKLPSLSRIDRVDFDELRWST